MDLVTIFFVVLFGIIGFGAWRAGEEYVKSADIINMYATFGNKPKNRKQSKTINIGAQNDLEAGDNPCES